MRTNNYFSHTSPTYGSPFDMMKSFGITYNAAGENIAMGQKTPEEVMKAWMNSPGHKANILNANFNYIGVGYDNNYWVQEFIGK
ncbi:Cysteine-rich secretory protein family protein [compost metagenome]